MSDVLHRIDALDLMVVKRKMTMPLDEGGYGWPEKEANAAIEGYRGFLKSVYADRQRRKAAANGGADSDVDSEKLSPDPVTDIVWHTHILFTEKYHRDCEALFGEYIHHRPVVEDSTPPEQQPVGA